MRFVKLKQEGFIKSENNVLQRLFSGSRNNSCFYEGDYVMHRGAPINQTQFP